VLQSLLLINPEPCLTPAGQAKSGASKRGGSKLRPGGSLLAEPGFPGAVPGGEAERSAFWIVMEVRWLRERAAGMHGTLPTAAAAAATACLTCPALQTLNSCVSVAHQLVPTRR